MWTSPKWGKILEIPKRIVVKTIENNTINPPIIISEFTAFTIELDKMLPKFDILNSSWFKCFFKNSKKHI